MCIDESVRIRRLMSRTQTVKIYDMFQSDYLNSLCSFFEKYSFIVSSFDFSSFNFAPQMSEFTPNRDHDSYRNFVIKTTRIVGNKVDSYNVAGGG